MYAHTIIGEGTSVSSCPSVTYSMHAEAAGSVVGFSLSQHLPCPPRYTPAGSALHAACIWITPPQRRALFRINKHSLDAV